MHSGCLGKGWVGSGWLLWAQCLVWGGPGRGAESTRHGGLEVRGQLPRPPDSSQFTLQGLRGIQGWGMRHLNSVQKHPHRLDGIP